MTHDITLPELSRDLVIADGGMETTLIFHEGRNLPCFASFVLLDELDGRETLRRYYDAYIAIARRHGIAAVLDSPTWRANPDWGEQLGYSGDTLDAVNRDAVGLLAELRAENPDVQILISGCIGPRGDGYRADELMTAADAEGYHAPQVGALAAAGVDLVTALTMTYPEEAVGIVRAARTADVPAVVSFTVETDGMLPNGQTLAHAIEQVDRETDGAAAYFMVNCAHPTHFSAVVEGGGPWTDRIRGLRANASAKSHAELDEAEELDEGEPSELAAQYVALRSHLRGLNVVGGCCGTDDRHVAAIAAAWLAVES